MPNVTKSDTFPKKEADIGVINQKSKNLTSCVRVRVGVVLLLLLQQLPLIQIRRRSIELIAAVDSCRTCNKLVHRLHVAR